MALLSHAYNDGRGSTSHSIDACLHMGAHYIYMAIYLAICLAICLSISLFLWSGIFSVRQKRNNG